MPFYEPRQPVHSGATYRVKFDYGSIHVALYQGTAKVGIITAMFSTDRGDNRASPNIVALRAEYPDTQFYPQVLFVWKAAVAKEHHGKKLGRGMYEALMQAVYNKHGPFLFAPMKDYGTGFGSTSDDAMRVWKSLSIRYPSSGNVIAVVDRPRITDPLMSTDNSTEKVASRFLQAAGNEKAVALMKFLSGVATRAGVAEHVYVVGGAVRNHVMGVPAKDVDCVVDSLALGKGRDSEWFTKKVMQSIPAATTMTTNTYGVCILSVTGPWFIGDVDLSHEQIEIANARSESYGKAEGKGYKPDKVEPASMEADSRRRDFSLNTLLWRLSELADGPDKAAIIDLTGVGLQHLKERLLKTPMDPDQTFHDDATRILRVEKFLWKYHLKLAPDVAAAMSRQAPKMKNMPWEAIAKILIDNILSEPFAQQALAHMAALGIVDVLADMIQENEPMQTYMARQLKAIPNMGLFFDLARLGLGSHTPISFLSPTQQNRLEEITIGMSHEDANAFLTKLKVPPVDNMALITEFKLKGADRGIIAPNCRALLLEQPELAEHPERLQAGVHALVKKQLGQ